jgi:phosphoribosyl-ATP pyrophosphohydrolase
MTLDDLEARIASRAAASPDESYTAKLIARGMNKCAQKLGEEATEAVIAAVTGDRAELVKESADVLYHLLVVLRASGVPLADVMAELDARTAQSGLEEKAARPTTPRDAR